MFKFFNDDFMEIPNEKNIILLMNSTNLILGIALFLSLLMIVFGLIGYIGMFIK